MSVIEQMMDLEQRVEKRQHALKTALAVARLDADAQKSLVTYIRAFRKAQRQGDLETQRYVLDAIAELFSLETDDESPEDWDADALSTAEGRKAAAEIRQGEDDFFRIYHALRKRSGLTVRALAEASRLSPTTINAIDQERVKPQRRTLEALARGLGVRVEDLHGR